jgi:hypothetical protein
MSTVTSPFTAKASNSEGGDYERPPTGSHPAVLIGLIDLGTHGFVYQGERKEARKLLFAWELTAEQNKQGENFVVAADFTWSLGKNANLRKFLEGWTGRGFANDEEFDIGSLLGKSCVVNLTEGQTAKGNKFIEVASATPPMRGLTVPPAKRPIYAFSLAQETSATEDPDIPDWVPYLYGRKVVDEVKASIEWGKLPNF